MILKNISENAIIIDIDGQKLKVNPDDKISVRDSYGDQLLNMYPNYLSVCTIVEKGTIEVKFACGGVAAEYGELSVNSIWLPAGTTITSEADKATLTFSNGTTVVATVKKNAPEGVNFYERDISGFSSNEDGIITAIFTSVY